MKLNKEQVDLLQQFADDNDVELRTDYSGRCMFGRSCIGFVTDESPFSLGFNLCDFLTEENEPSSAALDLIDAFAGSDSSMDNMGLSTIIYFSRISVDNEQD